MSDAITAFYKKNLPKAELKNNILHAACPFCTSNGATGSGTIVIFLNRESYFHGYFRCLNRCVPGGFALHFARTAGIDLRQVPGYDPDREYFHSKVDFPTANINNDIIGFTDKLTPELISTFSQSSIQQEVLREMQIGYNGRYLVYPYVQSDSNCYAARCIHPDRPNDTFWYGNEQFAEEKHRLFNGQDIDRCENGSLVITEGEDNLLVLKQLGLPCIAVPTAADLQHLEPLKLAWVNTLFLWVNHSDESERQARAFATRAGYKVRLIRWPEDAPRNYALLQLAADSTSNLQATVFAMIRDARAFSPFPTPAREYQQFTDRIILESGTSYYNLTSGFTKMDQALEGVHGINVLGGTPKAGKSSFLIQIATDMAKRKIPVIYYDFENGRQKIYFRTLCRLSRLPGDLVKSGCPDEESDKRLQQAHAVIENLLPYFRVVNDRKLTPELMRRHIDFLRHETQSEYTVVVIDSLNKLPFKDLSERRTGIDGWLRQLEAIRDEMQVSFLVISELTRGEDGQFDRQPHLGSFKGSGDIGYSADNAMVLMPNWDPFDNEPPQTRTNDLWLVASREQSPGRIARYQLDYPYWGFSEL